MVVVGGGGSHYSPWHRACEGSIKTFSKLVLHNLQHDKFIIYHFKILKYLRFRIKYVCCTTVSGNLFIWPVAYLPLDTCVCVWGGASIATYALRPLLATKRNAQRRLIYRVCVCLNFNKTLPELITKFCDKWSF